MTLMTEKMLSLILAEVVDDQGLTKAVRDKAAAFRVALQDDITRIDKIDQKLKLPMQKLIAG